MTADVSESVDLRTRFEAIIDAITTGRLADLDGLIRYDMVDHNLVPGQGDGLVGLKYWAEGLHGALPDLTASVEDILVDADKIAARVMFAGTNSGDLMGVLATDAYLEFESFFILEFTDGVVTQWWDASNVMGALRTVGARLTFPSAPGEL